MRTLLPLLIISCFFLSLGLIISNIPGFRLLLNAADPVVELQKQIDELTKLRKMSEEATQNLEREVANVRTQIGNISYQLNLADAETKRLEENIAVRETDLSDQYTLLSARVRSFYKLSRQASPILTLLSAHSAMGLTKQLSYQTAIAREDKDIIIATTQDILKLEEDKTALEQRQVQLSAMRTQFERDVVFFEGEIRGARDHQADLAKQIADLTAQQRAILAARSGSAVTSAGEVPIGSDFDASIAGFRQNAPSGYFAVFSFGAYTHRRGMSQYGAKGRAEDGQSYRDILKAYYGKEPVDKDTGGTISVQGHGDLDFENYYLMGIAEMPSSWPKEALKAQAVAARTYAYRFKQEGRSICTTEACQVFLKSKADNVPSEWRQAVEETRGKIIEDVVTFYSSTSGGYLTTSGWDTTDGSGGGEWTTRAWETKGNSPWFYKAWYRQGYRNDSNACGRKPWMSEREMADILNAWLVLKKGEGKDADTGRILPVTINQCPIGGQSGNPYSIDELRDRTNNPVTSISGIPVATHNNSAQTTNVRFQTNRGEINIPGHEFKEVFNGRAPGYISIPQTGFSFFNIERQ